MSDQQPPDVFDVFLCHNSQDKPAVKEIGEQLKASGVRPWLDEWELPPGRPWQRELEKQIESISSAAVFVGEDGIGPWQRVELESFLREFVSREAPVIPVLLPNAPREPKLPRFLSNLTWVDFRTSDPDPMDRLVWGITGKKRMAEIPDRIGETAEAKDQRTKAMLVKRLAKYKQRSYQFIRDKLGEEFTEQHLNHLLLKYPDELRSQGIKGKGKGIALVETQKTEDVVGSFEQSGHSKTSDHPNDGLVSADEKETPRAAKGVWDEWLRRAEELAATLNDPSIAEEARGFHYEINDIIATNAKRGGAGPPDDSPQRAYAGLRALLAEAEKRARGD